MLVKVNCMTNMEVILLTTVVCLLPIMHCQHFNLDDHQKRIQKGKENFERFNRDEKYNSPCWEKAMSKLKNGCRKMTDTEQSFLALQFSNCHLERSGLDIYECDIKNFKTCTREMAKNIIAFQSYTEFFTHVNDICFYLQSEIWRENTESTIDKLSKTSSESLETIAKSMLQQKEVLSAQEESLKNQRDILHNEKLLSETLVNSAESARDVFLEVRDHAKEQKAVFSETFKHLFDSVEKLSNLQKMLLGEFIGLQSFAFYFVASIVCYLFTSTPRTTGARLPLFISLLLLIISERVYVNFRINKDVEDKELSSEEIHAMIWTIRKIFLLVATVIVLYFIIRFKDYTRVNHAMLQQIQDQIHEIKKLQETQHTIPRISDTDGDYERTLVPNSDKLINDVTEQLELSLMNYVTSTPTKKVRTCARDIKPTMTCSLQFPDSEENGFRKRKPSKDPDADEIRSKTHKPKPDPAEVTANDNTLSESRYNLRSRRSFEITCSSINQSTAPVNKSARSNKKGKPVARTPKEKSKNKKQRKPAFFSSDDDE